MKWENDVVAGVSNGKKIARIEAHGNVWPCVKSKKRETQKETEKGETK